MRQPLAASLLVLTALLTATAFAQTPAFNKPVRLVVGGPPGGGPDTVARLLAQHLNLGQTVIVENRNGAAQMMAADHVARSAADGTVLFLASQTAIAISPVLQQVKTVEPLRDFTGVGLVGSAPMMLVAGPSLKAATVKDIITLAKARPGELNFGNGGVGTTPHMTGTLFAITSGTRLTSVPYPGEQAAMIDIMAGRVEMMFANASSALPHVRGGKLRAVAVTSSKRLPHAPEVPTMDEAGVPGFASATWYGIVAPAATPRTIVAQLNAELNRVLALPDVQEKLGAQAFTVEPTTPEAFNRFMQSEHAKWGKLIRDANIQSTDTP